MFTKKDKKIAIQKDMIEERNKFIKKLSVEMQKLKEKNIEEFEENKKLRFEKEELKNILKEILKLAGGNVYNNEKIVLGKILELVETVINN